MIHTIPGVGRQRNDNNEKTRAGNTKVTASSGERQRVKDDGWETGSQRTRCYKPTEKLRLVKINAKLLKT